MLADALIVLGLIFVNALFAAAEVGILTVRRSRLQELASKDIPGAKAVLALRDQPERFLATVQVGVTVVSVTAAAYGEDRFGRAIAAAFAPLGSAAETVAFIVVVAGISYLTIVIGELVPKSLALRHAEGVATSFVTPVRMLAALARPIVWLLTASSNVVLRLFGDKTTFTEARLSREELTELVEAAAQTGSLDKPTSEIAARAIQFGQVTVDELKVPIEEMVAIPRTASVAEIRRILLESGKSRMPVFDGTPDKIVGYVIAKDVLSLVWEPELIILADLIRPVSRIPASRRAVEVLRELQRGHAQLAIVVDDAAAPVGLVTTEDLVEELVGEILSEAEVERIRVAVDGSAVVQGTVPVREVNRALATELPEEERAETLAGLVLRLHGWLPKAGAQISAPDGSMLEVLEATARRVISVRVRPPAPPASREVL